MTEFIELIKTQWPDILQYAMIALDTFLVYLYKKSSSGITESLTSLFKEKSAIVTENCDKIEEILKAQKEKYIEMADKYDTALKHIENLENTIILLAEGIEGMEVVEDETERISDDD